MKIRLIRQMSDRPTPPTMTNTMLILAITALCLGAIAGPGLADWANMAADPDRALAMAADGSVYSTGWLWRDEAAGFDAVTMKVGPEGRTEWVEHFGRDGNWDQAKGLVLDEAGNCYVVVSSGGDLVTIKYDADGVRLWCEVYPARLGFSLSGNLDLALSGDGRLYVSGYARHETDPGGADLLLLAYDLEGALVWERRFGGGEECWAAASGVSADRGLVTVRGVVETAPYESGNVTLVYDRRGERLELDVDQVAEFSRWAIRSSDPR